MGLTPLPELAHVHVCLVTYQNPQVSVIMVALYTVFFFFLPTEPKLVVQSRIPATVIQRYFK